MTPVLCFFPPPGQTPRPPHAVPPPPGVTKATEPCETIRPAARRGACPGRSRPRIRPKPVPVSPDTRLFPRGDGYLRRSEFEQMLDLPPSPRRRISPRLADAPALTVPLPCTGIVLVPKSILCAGKAGRFCRRALTCSHKRRKSLPGSAAHAILFSKHRKRS